MTSEEAEAMRKQLAQHFHAPVMTVNEFCDVLRRWSEVAKDYLVASGYLHSVNEVEALFLATHKSSLLGRMIYGGEAVRTEPCPECKGVWRGCFLKCPCGGCGWLPKAEQTK